MLTGVERNAYLGIGQISDDGQIAYDTVTKIPIIRERKKVVG
jgi:hypothetical protein